MKHGLHLSQRWSIIITNMEEKESLEIQEFNERETVAERRREQFEMRLRGSKRSEITEALSERYGVASSTIDQDWQRRKDWLLDVVGVTDITSLVASTVGSLNLSQSFRKKILDSLIDLCDRFAPSEKDGPMTEAELDGLEELPIVWNMLMKLLNDMDSSEKNKAEILLKLGILKEAPKKYIVDKKEVKIEHKIDWNEVASNLDEEARMKLFDTIDAIDIEGVDATKEEKDA